MVRPVLPERAHFPLLGPEFVFDAFINHLHQIRRFVAQRLTLLVREPDDIGQALLDGVHQPEFLGAHLETEGCNETSDVDCGTGTPHCRYFPRVL